MSLAVAMDGDVDAVAVLLMATAVGFVEAGIGSRAPVRLRVLADGDVHALQRALAAVELWDHVDPVSRVAAIRLLRRAAR